MLIDQLDGFKQAEQLNQLTMHNLVAVCLINAQPFVRYATHFLVHSTDIPDVSRLKFEILTLTFPHADQTIKDLILSELEHFTRSSNSPLARESVRAIGRCAQVDADTSRRCLTLLLQQIASQDGDLIAESVTVIRHLIQQDPDGHVSTVIRLARTLDTTSHTQARASIVWLVGEYAGLSGEHSVAPDVLRILTKGFSGEAEPVKLQIVLLAAKVYLHYLIDNPTPSLTNQTTPQQQDRSEDTADPNDWNAADPPSTIEPSIPTHQIVLLYEHIQLLARYDTSYDLRDRARLFRALLSDPRSTQLASLLLLAPKPVPQIPSPSEAKKVGYHFGVGMARARRG